LNRTIWYNNYVVLDFSAFTNADLISTTAPNGQTGTKTNVFVVRAARVTFVGLEFRGIGESATKANLKRFLEIAAGMNNEINLDVKLD